MRPGAARLGEPYREYGEERTGAGVSAEEVGGDQGATARVWQG